MIQFNGITIDRKDRKISYDGRFYQVNGYSNHRPMRLLLLEALLLGGGLTRLELVDRVYGHREDGGPLCAENIIYVQMAMLRPILRHLGLMIRSQRGIGPDIECRNVTRYWLEPA